MESREFPIALEVLRGPYSNILYHSVSNSESYACSRLQSTLRNPILLHFVAFFHVASLFSTGVDMEKEGVNNEKALELTKSTVFHRGRQ